MSRTPTLPWRTGAAGLIVAAMLPLAAAAQSGATRPLPEIAASAAASFSNTVWVVVASTGVAPGTLYVFLSTGVLVISSEGSTPSFGTWTMGSGGLVMTEDGLSYKVEILESSRDRFRIRMANPGPPTEIAFAPAGPTPVPAVATARPSAPVVLGESAGSPGDTPGGAPYRCGAETFRIAFESGKAYVTLPGDTTVVLDQVAVADAPASRRTFSDGRIRVVEDTSESHTRVLLARAGFRPRPCTSLR